MTKIAKIAKIMKITEITKIAKNITAALDEDKDVKTSEVNHRDLKKIIAVDYPSFSAILPYRFFWDKKSFLSMSTA